MKNFLAGVLVTTSLALLGFQVVDEDPKRGSDNKVETKKYHVYKVEYRLNQFFEYMRDPAWEDVRHHHARVWGDSLTDESAKQGDNARLAHIFPQGKYMVLVWEKQLIESEKPKELDVGPDEEEVKKIK
jgi:hypothetical protein